MIALVVVTLFACFMYSLWAHVGKRDTGPDRAMSRARRESTGGTCLECGGEGCLFCGPAQGDE